MGSLRFVAARWVGGEGALPLTARGARAPRIAARVAGTAISSAILSGVALAALLSPSLAFAQARTIWGTAYTGTGSGVATGFTAQLPGATVRVTSSNTACQNPQGGVTLPVYGVAAAFPSGLNSNTAGFFAPAAPAGTQGIVVQATRNGAVAGCGPATNPNPQRVTTPSSTSTLAFSAPVDPNAVRLHFSNLDSGTYQFAAGVVPVNLAGNNIFDILGQRVNDIAANAVNAGCQANSGTNPAGSCGSINFTAASATITGMTWNTIDSNAAIGNGDGHNLALSITQPSLQVRKRTVGAAGSNAFTINYPANVVTNAATGDVAATTETVTVATNNTFVAGQQRFIANSGLDTAVTEVVPAGWRATAQCVDLANSSAVVAQIDTPVLGPANATVTLAAADVAPTAQIQCDFTNTRVPTLTVVKALAPTADPGTFVMTANGTAGTTAGNGATASAQVDSGAVATFSEAAGSAATVLTNYTSTWSCNTTPATTGSGTSGTLTMPANNTTCTITNTRRTATLQLAKDWAANGTAGHLISIGATTGGLNNTVAFDATSPAAANSGSPVVVDMGDVVTLPAETGAGAANYTTTVACTGGHTLSGTDGQQTNTLTITSTNPAVCTYTNTPRTATLQLAKAWADGSIAGNQVTIGATTGGANNTASFNATAPTAATSGTAVTVNMGGTITLPGETGTDVANFTTTVACTGGHTLSGTDGQQSNTLTITSTNPTVCTYTNTPRTATLQLAKAWANGSTAGNQVTIGATTGGANNTASFNATAPTAADSGTAVVVNVGNAITLPAETGTDVANFTTTVACTGGHTLSGTNGQQSNTLTITSTNPTVCTYTNTPIGHRLTLRKQWSGAAVGDDATITASRGGAAFATFASNADSADELDTDATTANVFAGETVTLAETLAAGNGGQYDSALACTGAADADPGDGLTIAAGDGDIVCTFTNTQRATDLSITKTNTPNSGASDQTGDTVVAGADTTYSVVVTNHAAAAVTGAVVRDTPQAGLDCPVTNPVTCTGAACPSGNLTVGDLGNGVTLGMLAAGGTAAFGFTCSVQ